MSLIWLCNREDRPLAPSRHGRLNIALHSWIIVCAGELESLSSQHPPTVCLFHLALCHITWFNVFMFCGSSEMYYSDIRIKVKLHIIKVVQDVQDLCSPKSNFCLYCLYYGLILSGRVIFLETCDGISLLHCCHDYIHTGLVMFSFSSLQSFCEFIQGRLVSHFPPAYDLSVWQWTEYRWVMRSTLFVNVSLGCYCAKVTLLVAKPPEFSTLASRDSRASKHVGEVLLSLDGTRARLCLCTSFRTVPWEQWRWEPATRAGAPRTRENVFVSRPKFTVDMRGLFCYLKDLWKSCSCHIVLSVATCDLCHVMYCYMKIHWPFFSSYCAPVSGVALNYLQGNVWLHFFN